MRRIILFLSLFILFTASNISFGQCTAGCTLVSTGNTRQVISTAPDCVINATYDIYNCGGVVSIVITGMTTEGSCDPTTMRSLSSYENDLNSLTEFATLAIVESYAYDLARTSTGANGLPPCTGSASQNVINIYTANCGAWVYCEYEVSDNAPNCPDLVGPHPEFGSNPKKVRVYQWQSCGTTCCRRTYSFCYSNGTGGYTGIKATSSVPVSVTACTGQSSYTSTTCQDGCSW